MRIATSLSKRIGLVSGVFVVLLFLAAASFLLLRSQNTFRERLDAECTAASAIIERLYGMGDLVSLRSQLSDFANASHWKEGILKDVSGQVIWSYDDKQIISSLPTKTVFVSRDVYASGHFAAGTLRVGKTSELEGAEWRHLTFWMGVTALLSWLIYFFTTWAVSSRTLLPLTSLLFELKREAANNTISLSDWEKEDELARIRRWFLLLAEGWRNEKARSVRSERLAAQAALATQVSHDIRSPLATLLAVLQYPEGLNQESRIQIRTSVNRIRDVANNLLDSNRGKGSSALADLSQAALNGSNSIFSPSEEPYSAELLSSLIEASISQKRIQFRENKDIEIDFSVQADAASVFVDLQPTELHRLLSNLTDNAIEALDGKGIVKARLEISDAQAKLTIDDNGKGIPAEVLNQIGERGATFGKENGNGLGVHHAKHTLEAWGGTLKISSVPEKGTSVVVLLPLSEEPTWFCKEICLSDKSVLTIVDDDPSIHGVWEKRLKKWVDNGQISLIHLYTPSEFLDWYRKNLGEDRVLHLFDFDFPGFNQTGLDLVEMTGLAERAVLVTSRWDERAIRARCQKIGLRILPKSLLGIIAIDVD